MNTVYFYFFNLLSKNCLIFAQRCLKGFYRQRASLLGGVEFKDLDLSNRDFSYLDLEGRVFDNCNLDNSIFIGSNLKMTSFHNCSF